MDLAPGTRVVVYARVSMKGQRLDVQVDDLAAFIGVHGLVAVRWYVEKVSGKTVEDRAQYEQLFSDLENGVVSADVVLCTRIDRWGRDGMDNVVGVWRLSKLGVGFCGINDSTEMFPGSPPSIKFLTIILAGAAGFVVDLQREACLAGMQKKRDRWAAGEQEEGERWFGHPKVELDDYGALVLETLAETGVSLRKMEPIMRKLTGTSICRSTLRRIIVDAGMWDEYVTANVHLRRRLSTGVVV